jgi:hypothetical protein
LPFERRDDDDDKKKNKPYKKDKGYKRSDKPYKKKLYCEVHIGQEWESNDESSNSDRDGVATVAIKGTSSSKKSLFLKFNQGRHTCLMAKENKRKVKPRAYPLLIMSLVMMIMIAMMMLHFQMV